MKNSSSKILVAFLLLSKCLAKLSVHALDLKTPSAWSQTKAAAGFDKPHSQEEQAVSNINIATYITSRDFTSTCTQTEHLLAFRKHEKLKKAALREDFRHEIITEAPFRSTVTAVLGSVGCVIGHVWPPAARTHLKRDCRRTPRVSAEQTDRRGTSDGTIISGIYFCSGLKYSNVECLSTLD